MGSMLGAVNITFSKKGQSGNTKFRAKENPLQRLLLL
jgi:hypothetical protein